MSDALDRLLELVRSEGMPSGEGLAAFAGGLRERARLVLEERVRPLEARIRALEVSVASLEREAAWRQEAMTGLEAEVAGLKGEAQSLQQAWDTAAASHEKLLAHHRDVVSLAVQRFAAAASLPVWKFRSCRMLLQDSAALFAREIP
jgi:hypothetical protein